MVHRRPWIGRVARGVGLAFVIGAACLLTAGARGSDGGVGGAGEGAAGRDVDSGSAIVPDVYSVDVSGLDGPGLEMLRAIPAVDGWLECGDTLVLFGTAELPRALEAWGPRISWARHPHDPAELVLLRSVEGGRLSRCVADLELPAVATAGAWLVALASPDVAARLRADPRVELRAAPRDTVLVRRADRMDAGRSVGTGPDASPTPILQAVAQAVDPDDYRDFVADLEAFGTRYTHTAGFPAVTSWVQAEFQAMGLPTTFDSYQISGKTRRNVVAEIPGDVTPDDVWILCGHVDSTSTDPWNQAPGADDNASGTAGVLEAARLLRQYRFDATLRFIAFSGEEQGLVGSYAYVGDLVQSGELGDVKGVINMDMIAYLNSGTWDLLVEGQPPQSNALMDQVLQLVPQFTSLVPFVSTNPWGSDHVPFIQQGVGAILLIEHQALANPNYHTPNDTLSTLTIPFAADVVRLAAVTAAMEAGIRGGYALRYGTGLAGTGGYVPRLSGVGSTNLGQSITVRLEDALGGASGVCVGGTASASLPAMGGTLLVDPAGAVMLPMAAGGPAGFAGAGTFDLNWTVPANPALTGLSLFLQEWLLDAGAAQGIAFTNGLELVLGV